MIGWFLTHLRLNFNYLNHVNIIKIIFTSTVHNSLICKPNIPTGNGSSWQGVEWCVLVTALLVIPSEGWVQITGTMDDWSYWSSAWLPQWEHTTGRVRTWRVELTKSNIDMKWINRWVSARKLNSSALALEFHGDLLCAFLVTFLLNCHHKS